MSNFDERGRINFSLPNSIDSQESAYEDEMRNLYEDLYEDNMAEENASYSPKSFAVEDSDLNIFSETSQNFEGDYDIPSNFHSRAGSEIESDICFKFSLLVADIYRAILKEMVVSYKIER